MEWILVAVGIALAAAVMLLLLRQRRTQELRKGFGPEYDRTVEARGDRRRAEAELLERRDRREKLEIRDLEPAARERYEERWLATQRRFVDQPAVAVAEADGLVAAVMRDRGYPVAEDFERRAADVSVDHPEVVEHYRAAHEISTRATQGQAGTEDLRRAMVHFRALFDDLLAGGHAHGERDGDIHTTRR